MVWGRAEEKSIKTRHATYIKTASAKIVFIVLGANQDSWILFMYAVLIFPPESTPSASITSSESPNTTRWGTYTTLPFFSAAYLRILQTRIELVSVEVFVQFHYIEAFPGSGRHLRVLLQGGPSYQT
jgi:hypothetical protein